MIMTMKIAAIIVIVVIMIKMIIAIIMTANLRDNI
jgi:hypothetical protein